VIREIVDHDQLALRERFPATGADQRSVISHAGKRYATAQIGRLGTCRRTTDGLDLVFAVGRLGLEPRTCG
jgi:hypothetical protein